MFGVVLILITTLALPIQAKIKSLEHISYYGFQEYRDRCTAIAAGASSYVAYLLHCN